MMMLAVRMVVMVVVMVMVVVIVVVVIRNGDGVYDGNGGSLGWWRWW